MAVAGCGPALAQPRGSYLESCTEVDRNGPFLEALCRDTRGAWVPSRLNLASCGRGEIANINGRLTCAEGRDSRRDYDRPGYGEWRGRGDRDTYDDRRDGRGYGRRGYEDNFDEPRGGYRERRGGYERY